MIPVLRSSGPRNYCGVSPPFRTFSGLLLTLTGTVQREKETNPKYQSPFRVLIFSFCFLSPFRCFGSETNCQERDSAHRRPRTLARSPESAMPLERPIPLKLSVSQALRGGSSVSGSFPVAARDATIPCPTSRNRYVLSLPSRGGIG